MSRNKFILLFATIIVLYFALPNEGVGLVVKANMMAVAPYIMAFVIIYLVITINVLKRALKKLDADLCDETVINAAKIMNITFDVKRMMGPDNLQAMYNRVNISRFVSIHAKTLLYDALRKKRLDIPPPSAGKTEKELHARCAEEVKAARIGTNKKNRKKKRARA
ncbi:hypothetical protein NE619_13415 [Anaerovorax odorimutans]|uniref:Uncharacterized protein n=1 Tax=Anaerovorax odorimutans TaxID=109327 RepID=A0ABT1RRB0_9FIRM|nr:hypothetical protein [Anaerovorax odorimutans]MCQ4637727.1 hypothetical protein [Anaerovorax odorimutans]